MNFGTEVQTSQRTPGRFADHHGPAATTGRLSGAFRSAGFDERIGCGIGSAGARQIVQSDLAKPESWSASEDSASADSSADDATLNALIWFVRLKREAENANV